MEANSGKKKKVSKAKKAKKQKALLLGVGLDNQDEHVRITRGPNFQLVGGTRETHEMMQETAIKFNEELTRRKKPLEALEPKEFVDIMEKLR